MRSGSQEVDPVIIRNPTYTSNPISLYTNLIPFHLLLKKSSAYEIWEIVYIIVNRIGWDLMTDLIEDGISYI